MKIAPLFYLLLITCLHLSPESSAQPKKKKPVKAVSGDDSNIVFTKVEHNIHFPGGANAWFKFANDNLDFAAILKSQPANPAVFKDSVVVQFIVDKDGLLSDFNFLKGNSAMVKAVFRLLKESPIWEPEEQCGRKVKAYKIMRVDVSIDTHNNVYKVEHFKNSYDYFNSSLYR
ncbi:MAG: hypothetical protein INR73_10640 [Williamsia sp.]|nr:hypothetical protein [Williamsia sp.]